MFANSFQSGFISVFYSVGSNPLSLWDKQVKNGHIRRVIDDEVKSLVLEVSGTNVATTYITCPIKPRASLGIKLPFLVMIIKNMKKYFTFEIQILDDKDMHRRFRVSNFQSTTKVRPFCTTMPIGLSSGWNQVQFNLADFTKRAYGSTYLETTRVQIHANVRIRRIYFADQLYSDEDLPNEFKLFIPVPGERRQSTKPAERSSIDSKGRGSKQLSDIKLKRKSAEEAVPSGAPPSPAEPPGGGEEPVTPAESPIPETPTEEGATTTASSTAAGGGSMDAQHGGDEGGDAPTTTEEEGGETPTAGEGAAPADGEGELVEGEAASEPPAGGEDAVEAPAGDEAAPGGGEETPAAEEGAPSEPPSEPPAEGAEETPTVEEGGGEAPAEEGVAEVTEAPPPAAEEAESAPEALEGDASEPAEGEAPPE